MKRTLVSFLVMLGLAHVSFAADLPPAIPAQFSAVTPPRLVPALVYEDANTKQHALSDYRGRYVLVNMWATWCGPCVHELPSLDALQKNFDPKVLVVLPLSEARSDSGIDAFYRAHGISHLPIAIDTAGTAIATLHPPGLPTTFLLNPEGQEIFRIEGDIDWDKPQILAFLRFQTANNVLNNKKE